MSNLLSFPQSKVRAPQNQPSSGTPLLEEGTGSEEFLLRLLLRLIRVVDCGLDTNVTTWRDENRIVVAVGPSVRGIWEIQDGQFSWIPAAYLRPLCQFRSVQDAARYTIHCIFQRPLVHAKPRELDTDAVF